MLNKVYIMLGVLVCINTLTTQTNISFLIYHIVIIGYFIVGILLLSLSNYNTYKLSLLFFILLFVYVIEIFIYIVSQKI